MSGAAPTEWTVTARRTKADRTTALAAAPTNVDRLAMRSPLGRDPGRSRDNAGVVPADGRGGGVGRSGRVEAQALSPFHARSRRAGHGCRGVPCAATG